MRRWVQTILVLSCAVAACGCQSLRRAREEALASTIRANRVAAIHDVTGAAIRYADEHDGRLPTTGELAEYLGRASECFEYVVVLKGQHEDHLKRVGGWPEVLVEEKNGMKHGEWAFGYVDGLATCDAAEGYIESDIDDALRSIRETMLSARRARRKR